MYHALVKRLAARNFDLINTHGHAELLASCSDDISHRFGGDHALGGQRHSKAALALWLDRLGRLVPGLRLTVTDMWVEGWPWSTVVFIRWTGAATFPDGTPYRQHGVHIVTLRWGKVTAIDANEDSQAVVELLTALAATGIAEAAVDPITS
ncbi:nuclear transport factor 2 family protein [Rathayibacter sp. VKM Ac-2927]|uniref:nuclear transport factor 2 family protein n=1 Tax=Rathayibacter sp. VKM Ac-2927 TaxID=2929478 RepID=UPI001FB4512C|nr:nuclear transport factor 2 family protein [Rathayibacter sp. VKM Ac-2927]MCJ1688462.1 nuclear transport factor 2 family protein [Rathayibacter sp. VKM Ac-2927]